MKRVKNLKDADISMLLRLFASSPAETLIRVTYIALISVYLGRREEGS